jgi:hypothetical protein
LEATLLLLKAKVKLNHTTMTKIFYQLKIVIKVCCLILLLSADHGSAASAGKVWTEVTSVGAKKAWNSITSSADGTKLAATVDDGNIWTSSDSGATWTEDTSVGAKKTWSSITSSTDGTKDI